MIGRATVGDVAAALARGETVIDVRTQQEYASGHIPGSRFMPTFAVPLHLSTLPRRRTIYVVCESGARGLQASQYLNERGYSVRNLDGGMGAWRGSGMPVSMGLEAGASA